MKQIALLGSTGSVGTSTLDVVEQHPGKFSVVAMAAGTNVDLLARQVKRFQPELVSVAHAEAAAALAERLGGSAMPEIVYGAEGLEQVARHESANFVMTAVVGSVGVSPTLAAIEAGKTIGLANKETLVSAGPVVMKAAKEKGVTIIPVDSEHSAVYQCLQGERREDVSRIILTASGGSFRHVSRQELENVTVAEALAHPNWSMGAKITIDSATMMNKGFEVIEAHWLFDLPYEQIDTILHYESIIHSMVEYKDRAVMAQLGTPDMRVPIQYALSYPERMNLDSEPLDLVKLGTLHFAAMDFERYPLLQLAYDCGKAGGTHPAVLNAANEVAVDLFLKGAIRFLEIETIVRKTCEAHQGVNHPTLEEIFAADRWARSFASDLYTVGL
ncbi:1-deoxy-D-xylulose-5-phosphate reductoisomerase [Brevibacillus centrosporus]|uniref:1-deoxy-D-xylulose 5-phosphate reductoisomerase n=1 Tax=Brevibacillus centrosporus TaxID=54910 RepID=A0A1I3NTQ8_9BACL|nr:1-deoxy-D-xylulose-5-phosphate reductoisomerase [Brevibacillus centrosporus]MEC2128475.1 1-deoxy-D-xylulose-5-phosphate reductoisomerase [Brevibacillus centrosporus]MED4909898.1 1-deoxy-D-xylulose-5-phosphate reductoisomerase [Brevibacillus centrosporus]RNB73683.1 1-deoxy-D-xylulose-5-phosphate reductoisomerase [Brevibacillus centrosporus]SFJ12698.1 1-deoxy-D-xylulose 5-phosphate reductoisomerase [Brevibacillus centrosporus]GED29050.1 1-deoxy-D-xylulose 5-phosphate reductoisomerase 2 [Brevi